MYEYTSFPQENCTPEWVAKLAAEGWECKPKPVKSKMTGQMFLRFRRKK
jgi:hypothetical protein